MLGQLSSSSTYVRKYVCCLCVHPMLAAVQARKESGNDAVERESFNGEAEIETDQAYNDRNEDESELIGFPLKHNPACMHPVDHSTGSAVLHCPFFQL